MLTRLLLRLRWTMAVIAAAVLITTVLSGWLYAHCKVPVGPNGPSLAMGIFGGRMDIIWSQRALEAECDVESIDGWEIWQWGFRIDHVAIVTAVWIPLWSLLIPPLALAIAGFAIKRKRPRLGECARCGYPLAGTAICPECGAPATGAASTQ